jgi:hypothetical protein
MTQKLDCGRPIGAVAPENAVELTLPEICRSSSCWATTCSRSSDGAFYSPYASNRADQGVCKILTGSGSIDEAITSCSSVTMLCTS